MADPLSMTASIASLLALGGKVSLQLYQLTSDVRSATKQTVSLAREIRTLCRILEKLKRNIGKLRHEELREDLKDVLQSCDESLKELEELLKTYTVRATDGIFSQGWKKLGWVIREKDVAGLHSQLEAHKLTLNVTLAMASRIETTEGFERLETLVHDAMVALPQLLEEKELSQGGSIMRGYRSTAAAIRRDRRDPAIETTGEAAMFPHRKYLTAVSSVCCLPAFQSPAGDGAIVSIDSSFPVGSRPESDDWDDFNYKYSEYASDADDLDDDETLLAGSGPDSSLEQASNRLQGVRASIMSAMLNRNKKKLKWCLVVAIHVFWLGMKLGGDGFLDLFVRVGTAVVREGVARGYIEGLGLIMKSCTKALLAGVVGGQSDLVQRALLITVEDLEGLIAKGKGKDVKHEVEAAMALFVQVCRTGNRQLIEMTAGVSAGAIEGLLGGPFKKQTVLLVETYGDRWVLAIQRRDMTETTLLARVALEELTAAARQGEAKVMAEFVPLFARILRQVLHPNSPDTERWLIEVARPLAHLVFTKQDDKLAENIITVGIEFLLTAAENEAYDHLRRIMLDMAIALLKALDSVGLLEQIETTTFEHLADEKFRAVRGGVDHLESQLLGVLETLRRVVGMNGDLRLSQTIPRFENAVRSSAGNARAGYLR